jgi:DNA-binding MarR family transcriptional regulator
MLAEIARRSANPPTMRELADAMVMDRSTLGHNLRPLERERLVELASHKGDGRSRLVLLTATGHSKYVEAKGPWKKAQARFEAAYGVQPAAELRSTLLEVATLDYSASF